MYMFFCVCRSLFISDCCVYTYSCFDLYICAYVIDLFNKIDTYIKSAFIYLYI